MKALILILFISGCATSTDTYEMHLEIKRGSKHATGYVQFEGIRHDLNIQVVTED